MDFGHFGDGPREPQPPSQTPPQQNGGASSGPGSAAGQPEQPIFMHTMEHPSVTCDVCNSSIRGFRYKCMECMDYDLCTVCERRGNHPGHVMMRIAFPEQSGGAIRRFLGSGATGAGVFGMGFPFAGRHGHHGHRERGFHRRAGAGAGGAASGRDSDGDVSGPEDPKAPNDCPYGLGRKGMKKWAKCMKKMAYQQRRSAEAYAQSAAQAAGTFATSSAAGLAGGPVPANSGTEQQQFDFTAAASQIQEFLNAFGIPIDVVELYDNYGNRGQPRAGEAAQPEAGAGAGASNSNASNAADSSSNNATTPPAAPGTSTNPIVVGFEGIVPNMQQLHLNSNTQVTTPAETTTPSAPVDQPSTNQAVNMELDTDSSGWTLLDTDNRPANTASVGPQSAETLLNFEPTSATATTTNESSENAAASVPPPPPTPTPTTAGGRLYPGLNQPHLQQLLSGVSQAMNSMVRNIPIVTNPSGPGSVGSVHSGPPSSEMDTRCTTTLNQLLAMGFSNHDGWLSRLVVAKNGDLEAVLNALFPVGSQ